MSSSAKGARGTSRRPPKYQNKFAFKHNPSSKKTAKILSISHSSLCKRCHDQIEWKKKYRKYKPIKQPKKCTGCQQRNITRAYHIMCKSCAGGRNVCAKCTKSKDEVGDHDEEVRAQMMKGTKAKMADVEKYLGSGLKEREKRKIIRQVEQGKLRVRTLDNGNIELFEPESESEEEEEAENENVIENADTMETE